MAGYPLPGNGGSLFRGGCGLQLVAGYKGGHPHYLCVYPGVFLSSTTKGASQSSPRPRIRVSASLFTTTTSSDRLRRVYSEEHTEALFGARLFKLLDMNFGEHPFHALR